MLIFHEHVGADDAPLLEVSAAAKVRRVVGAAAAVVDRRLRIGTQRPATRDHAARRGRREDRFRRDAVLDPINERAEQVLRLRPAAAAAVADARSAEQPIKALQGLEVRLAGFAVPRRHLPVVVDHAARIDELIVGADVREQLAAVLLEGIERPEGVRHIGDIS